MLKIFKTVFMFLRANPLRGLFGNPKQRKEERRGEEGTDKIDGSKEDKQLAQEGQDEKTGEHSRVGATWHIHVMEEPLVEEISYLQELADDLERERISEIQKKHIKDRESGQKEMTKVIRWESDAIQKAGKAKKPSTQSSEEESREV